MDARSKVARLKDGIKFDWYPFETLTALPLAADLIAPRFEEIRRSMVGGPMLDPACGDGDLSCVFSLLGSDVDALDSAAANYNRMDGVRVLGPLCGLPGTKIFDIDLDERFEFPRNKYGVTFFLGTLYHLKNPYTFSKSLRSAPVGVS